MKDVEKELVSAFLAAGKTFAAAESCTGGLIAKSITDVPGASGMFLGSIVSYANEVKERVLGVRKETLLSCGAVSCETAEQMARGVLSLTGADISVSVTGIAGPGGGTANKPVGLVYIAAASKNDGVFVTENHFSGNRDDVREQSKNKAISLALELLLTGHVSEKI
ncbi:MAG: CinA family protein [Eubacteriales bacterium]